MSGLERRTGVALWRQIADDIRASIGNGVYDETGRLPTESALASQFDVNRHTVRQALAALARDGIVETVQGRGSTVVPRNPITYPIGTRTRFSAGLSGQVAHARIRLIDASEIVASGTVADALGLPSAAPTLRLEMIGEADGTPVSRSTHWFDLARFSGLPGHLPASGSLTEALRACGVADYVRLWTEISAAPATGSDRTDLALEPGAVVLLTRAVNADTRDRPIQYSHTRFAADRVTLAVDTSDGPPPGA